jgi:hypothetical protein
MIHELGKQRSQIDSIVQRYESGARASLMLGQVYVAMALQSVGDDVREISQAFGTPLDQTVEALP